MKKAIAEKKLAGIATGEPLSRKKVSKTPEMAIVRSQTEKEQAFENANSVPQSTKKKYKSHKRDNNLADLRRREKTNQLSDAEQAVLDKRREDVHEAVIKYRAENKPTV